MQPDPRLLPMLVALADELHFGRAADRLGITQSALSQQLKRLELQLGTTLVSRTRSSVALTPAGAAALVPAREATDAAAAVARAVEAVAEGAVGELRFGFSPGVHLLAQDLLGRFARARPRVRVSARQESSGTLAALVAAGELEAALGCWSLRTEGVEVETVARVPLVAAINQASPLGTDAPVALAELRGETFALVDPGSGPGYNDAVLRLCREAGFEARVPPEPRGPMAWELGVRSGHVGLTTRVSVPALAVGCVLRPLEPVVRMDVDLITPRASCSLVAAALRSIARQTTSSSPVIQGWMAQA